MLNVVEIDDRVDLSGVSQSNLDQWQTLGPSDTRMSLTLVARLCEGRLLARVFMLISTSWEVMEANRLSLDPQLSAPLS